MKYYIKAKRGTTETQIDLSTVTEVRILDKENAEVYVGTTKCTVSGAEMIGYLINCCRILEQSQSSDALKSELADKLKTIETIGTKIDALSTTISKEADKIRDNHTENVGEITKSIAECSEQLESISAGIQNPFESVAVEDASETIHEVMIANIEEVWVGPHSGCIIMTSGSRIGTSRNDAIKIKEHLTQLSK